MPSLAHTILHTVMKCCTEKIDISFVGKNIPKLQIKWNNAEKVKLHKTKTRHACYTPLIEQLTTYILPKPKNRHVKGLENM